MADESPDGGLSGLSVQRETIETIKPKGVIMTKSQMISDLSAIVSASDNIDEALDVLEDYVEASKVLENIADFVGNKKLGAELDSFAKDAENEMRAASAGSGEDKEEGGSGSSFGGFGGAHDGFGGGGASSEGGW